MPFKTSLRLSERRTELAQVIPSVEQARMQFKCLAFGDRIIKLNDFLLKEATNKKPAYKIVKGKRVYEKTIPVHMQSVAVLCNQLLRSGTSIGAKQLLEQREESEARFSYPESRQKST